MSNGLKITDLSYLESIADGDTEIIKDLIIIFLDQVPEFITNFKTHFEQKDWKQLAGLAHKAKSSVISMGMDDLGNIDLKNLELMAKSYRIDELKKMANISIKEQEEISTLQKTIDNYPIERKEWLNKNSTEATMQEIIHKCIDSLNTASVELKNNIENN